MKKKLVKMADTFCEEFCKYKPTEPEKGPCQPEGKCPLLVVADLIRSADMDAEKKIKRIKDHIKWCDDIQNSNDESPEAKMTAKRIAYDQIRKLVNGEGEHD